MVTNLGWPQFFLNKWFGDWPSGIRPLDLKVSLTHWYRMFFLFTIIIF
jgi:hypothetical protein